jgi:hypothetical protein
LKELSTGSIVVPGGTISSMRSSTAWVEEDVGRGELAFELLHGARPDQRRGDGRVVEHERDRDLDVRDAGLVGELRERVPAGYRSMAERESIKVTGVSRSSTQTTTSTTRSTLPDRTKYGRYAGYVRPMISPEARATTWKLVPRDRGGRS